MAFPGVITTEGINQATYAAANGWKIDFSAFAVSDTVGTLDASRTTTNTIIYKANPASGFQSFVNVDSDSIKVICEIPIAAEYPTGTPISNFQVREIYLFITDPDSDEELFFIGQPSSVFYDTSTSITFEIVLNLQSIGGIATFVNTQAIEIENHNIDPNAHPPLREAMEELGGIYPYPNENYTFTSQWVDYYNITFDTGVTDNTPVYKNNSGVYVKAIADGTVASRAVGFADVTNGLVRFGGLFNIGHSETAGTRIFLSDSVAGTYTTAGTDVQLGVAHPSGVILAGGTGGGSGQYTVEDTEFTDIAGDTTLTITYNPQTVEVYYNGVLLAEEDYTATNGTSITLVEPVNYADDIITVRNYGVFEIANHYTIEESNTQRKESMLLTYEEANGVSPQSFVNDVWNVRNINTEKYNYIVGASLNDLTYEITLPAGVYEVLIHSACNDGKSDQVVRLYNETDNETVMHGINVDNDTSSLPSVSVVAFGGFEINDTKTFTVQQFSDASGLSGNAVANVAYTLSEVYAQILIRKIGE